MLLTYQYFLINALSSSGGQRGLCGLSGQGGQLGLGGFHSLRTKTFQDLQEQKFYPLLDHAAARLVKRPALMKT